MHKLSIIRGDITTMHTDAIVNAANTSLLGGEGVDGAIHRAAGPKLMEECKSLKGCKMGCAKITKGYALPAKYVIHTPGPIWNGGIEEEPTILKSCYESCLRLVEEYRLKTVAFPSISTGAYRFPRELAAYIAVGAFKEFLQSYLLMERIYMVCFDEETERAYKAAYLSLI